MKKLIGWFVVVLILSTGVTVWWNFGGKEVIANLPLSLPVFNRTTDDPVDYSSYTNFDIPEGDPFLDPKEIPPESEDTIQVAAYYDPIVEYRLSRDIARENAKIGLEKLAQAGNADASLELLNQTRNTSKEEELEGILKAKGYGDTVISIEDSLVKVIAKNLTKDKVEAIGEILYNLTTFGRDQIVLTSI
ncbi:MAG: SpoIIIAH-like family protein [Firmicutes bacterium]|nr:SpoIIIAH-like family protein [Bacillota bacterium]MDD4693902.1 SpoIIIAH-like family protein [Bacillota bacterium]